MYLKKEKLIAIIFLGYMSSLLQVPIKEANTAKDSTFS